MSDQIYTTEKGYVLKELFITSSNGDTINIFNIMLELNMFEDIYNSTVSGSIVINDSIDLFAAIPLSGFEFVKVLLEKPGSEREVVFEKIFRIYKMQIADVKEATTSNQTYVLYFVLRKT